MLPSSHYITRLPRPSSLLPSLSSISTSSTPPSSATPVNEPGYLGYLSHALSNLTWNLPWSSASHAKDKPTTVESHDRSRPIVMKISRSEVTARTTSLVSKLIVAETPSSQLLRVQELSEHLKEFPPTRLSAVQDGRLISVLLSLESSAKKEKLRNEARLCLALCGYVSPPKGRGINLLAIDGGGTRGMMGLEVLEALETASGKKVHELFDHMIGVSTGAIITTLLGVKKLSVDEARQLYLSISRQLFSQSMIRGTSGLIWNHSYYDTKKWIATLNELVGEQTLVSSSKEEGTPKVAILSTIVNLPLIQAHVFRNYEYPPGKDSHYRGGGNHSLAQAVQASAAAPGYFEEVVLGTLLHQDGGVIANNPTAIGIHETRMLWPEEKLNCVVSIGNGRSVQEPEPTSLFTASNAVNKMLKIVDSATDTEATHRAVCDLLSEKVYYRLNPYMTHPYGLDEIQPDRLDQMVVDAKLYVRRNKSKIEAAADRLILRPTVSQMVTRTFKHYGDSHGRFKAY